MKDRIPKDPGRVLITPENGSAPFYATMTRADNPEQEGTPLNKNSLLKDTTAALFGLGTDALPDDVLAALSPMMQHAWRRKHTSYIEVKTAAPTAWSTAPGVFDGYPVTASYSKSISISSDGTITLVNATTEKITADNFESKVLGKYVTGLSTNDPGTSTNTIYYINSDATTGRANVNTTGVTAKPYIKSGAFVINAIASEVTDYVVSPERNTYPDSGEFDGKEYAYIGVPFENLFYAPQIETGSYNGTGASGSGNANSLTFDFAPRIIILTHAYYNVDEINGGGWWDLINRGFAYGTSGKNTQIIINADTLTTSYKSGLGFAVEGSYTPSAKKSADGKTITWYGSNAASQANQSSFIYYYIAIG